jgi:hypothetical protein
VLMIIKGRYNMSNPPPPPTNRPPGHLKAPIPSNDKERVDVRQFLSELMLGLATLL